MSNHSPAQEYRFRLSQIPYYNVVQFYEVVMMAELKSPESKHLKNILKIRQAI